MLARVSRSARLRQRQLSERTRPHRPQDGQGEQSRLDRALIQTSRVVMRIGTLIKDKYNALVNYLYEETPRLASGRSRSNRVMQAPIEQEMEGETSRAACEDSESSEDDLRRRCIMKNRIVSDSDDERGSVGYVTALSRSRSRSVARKRRDSARLPDVSLTNMSRGGNQPQRSGSRQVRFHNELIR